MIKVENNTTNTLSFKIKRTELEKNKLILLQSHQLLELEVMGEIIIQIITIK